VTLYEIDRAIEDTLLMAIDPETGEVKDEALLDQFEHLQMDREHKVENIGLFIKNLEADAKAIKEESKNLAARAKAAESKAEHLRNYLEFCLGGEKFQTPRLSVSFRHAKKVEVDLEMLDAIPEQYLRFKDPEPDKKAIGDALKAGEEIPGCGFVDSVSLIIK
jgi:seryl-tRNA synthetase